MNEIEATMALVYAILAGIGILIVMALIYWK